MTRRPWIAVLKPKGRAWKHQSGGEIEQDDGAQGFRARRSPRESWQPFETMAAAANFIEAPPDRGRRA